MDDEGGQRSEIRKLLPRDQLRPEAPTRGDREGESQGPAYVVKIRILPAAVRIPDMRSDPPCE